MGFITKEKIYNFSIYGFGQAVNLISPLLIVPYIVSVCGESGLGKAGVGFSFALIAIVLVDAGSYINGTKDIAINRNDHALLEEKFNTIYLAKLLLLLAVLVVCSAVILFVPFFHDDRLQLFLSLSIVVGQFLNPTWFFQGTQDFKWISGINVVSKGLYIAAVFVFIKVPAQYVLINAFLGLGMIVAGLMGIFRICSRYRIDIRKAAPDKALALIRSEFSLSVSQLFFSFYQYAPIIIISYICGSFTAGQYRIIDQIVMIFRTYLQMFFNFIYAEICVKIFEDIKQGLGEWKKYNLYNTLLILFGLALFFFNTNLILRFFKVGPGDLPQMAHYLKLGLVIPVVMCLTFALKQLMFSFDRNRPYIQITIVSSVLNMVLMVVLIRLIGITGAFLSIIVIELAIGLAYSAILRRKLFSKQL
jgi:O-antigen/teichoic acid export membrane protein